MGKIVKINPIKKDYPSNFKTMESSLASKGYVRSPGTKRYLMPKMEADGRYRTGLDEKALYLKNLSEEDRAAEIEFIKETLKKLKDSYPDTDFGPRSKVWNAFSDSPIKVSHITFGNETFILNVDDSLEDLLTYCWVRVHPGVARSMESFQRGECPDCQYYMANEEAENRAIFAKKKQINKAIATFESLTPTKKKQIARLMGLPITDDSTDEAVYNMMDNTLKKAEIDAGEYKNLPALSIFNELVIMKDERLKIKDLIDQAIRYNVYRKGAGDDIKEGNEVIASGKEALVDRLLKDENQQELIALETKLKQKKFQYS